MKSAPKKVSVGVGSKREVGGDGVAEGSGSWRAAGGVDHGFLDGRELAGQCVALQAIVSETTS